VPLCPLFAPETINPTFAVLGVGKHTNSSKPQPNSIRQISIYSPPKYLSLSSPTPVPLINTNLHCIHPPIPPFPVPIPFHQPPSALSPFSLLHLLKNLPVQFVGNHASSVIPVLINILSFTFSSTHEKKKTYRNVN
jgi:hypothetical protein